MKFFLLFALWMPAIAHAGDAVDFAKANWQKIREEDGIQIFRWEPPNSELFAFKGDGIIEAPLPRVATVLLDVSRRKEWVKNLIESHLVRRVSAHERIEYIALRTPPLTANRDFVYRGTAAWHPDTKQLMLSFTSVDDPAAPETKMVRGRTYDSTYTLTSLDNGRKTRFECRFLVDPRGSVAKWIVNFVQKNVPFNAIKGARQQVQRADVVESTEVQEILR